MSTTRSVLEHHVTAFGDQDLEAILEDYDDESVIITDTETYRGRDEISGLFENLFADFSQAGSTIQLHHQAIEDDVAHIVWEGETPDNEYEFATDTFIIRDGTIVTQTFAGKIDPK
ncbi:nuclear transport factor 2 family protein [Haladaptatus sp. NG-SE-30]